MTLTFDLKRFHQLIVSRANSPSFLKFADFIVLELGNTRKRQTDRQTWYNPQRSSNEEGAGVFLTRWTCRRTSATDAIIIVLLMCALLWVTGQQVRTKMETDYQTSDSKSAELKLHDDDGVSTIHSILPMTAHTAEQRHYTTTRSDTS